MIQVQEQAACPTLAALLHCVQLEVKGAVLEPGIRLVSFGSGRAKDLYFKLCRDHGVDEGDPLAYETMAVLDPDPRGFLGWSDPETSLQLLLSLVAITKGRAVGNCRVIASSDGLMSSDESELACDYGHQTEFVSGPIVISGVDAGNLARSWSTVKQMRYLHGPRGRVSNALVHFHSAWRAPYVAQMLMNLELTLSVLFGSGHADIIAERLTQLLNGDPGATAIPVMEMFAVRQRMVADGQVDESRVCDHIRPAFRLTASALRRLLLDEELALAMDSVATQ